MWADKAKSTWDKSSKIIIIVASVVLGLAFIGSILAAIFAGGELIEKVEKAKVKGMLRLDDIAYETEYMSGDTFVFDKGEDGKIFLYVKDPDVATPIRDDDLADDLYGFKVNGSGEIISDPSSIVLDSSVTKIDVVSVAYPTVKATIPVTVLGAINTDALVSDFLFEAENANVYRSGNLLTEEEMQTQPQEKPYISSYGDVKEGEDCSGGACLRNFQSSNMKIEFKFVCLEDAEVTLQVMVCKRAQAKRFGESYLTTLNGETLTALDNVSVPAGNGYYEPYTLSEITIKLKRGLNTITFESGEKINKTNPNNFDAIRIVAQSNLLGDMSCVLD